MLKGWIVHKPQEEESHKMFSTGIVKQVASNMHVMLHLYFNPPPNFFAWTVHRRSIHDTIKGYNA